MTRNSGLLLDGLDGANPLAFLAALGTVIILHRKFHDIRLGWKMKEGSWKPVIGGCGDDKEEFLKNLLAVLKNNSMTAFDIVDNRACEDGKVNYKKMPFKVGDFIAKLQSAQVSASINNREEIDFLAGFGTDLYPSNKNEFQDTSFRMVRSGDSKGQGTLFYAKDIREKTRLEHIRRALFQAWDYQDKFYTQQKPGGLDSKPHRRKYYSLRWDPIEDQRYALRWQDPENKSGTNSGPGTMLAANSLAIEALRYFPVVTAGKQAHTTGFHKFKQRDFFIWPIWRPLVGMETIRSLLTLDELSKEPVPRRPLIRSGIEEVYRSQRIQNGYYNNFTLATPA